MLVFRQGCMAMVPCIFSYMNRVLFISEATWATPLNTK